MKTLKAGIIGLGMIGEGITISLSARGFFPAVYDIKPDVPEKIRNISKSFESPSQVAAMSDVVMVCVTNSKQAIDVINGPDGLLKAANNNLTICLISTVSLPVIYELAKICNNYHVGFIDCGVTPGNLAAQNAMVAMVGGEDDIVKKALPVLEGWSKKVIHCGGIGAGMATKIAKNVVTFGSWRIVKEAQKLVEAVGIEPEKLLEVIESGDPNGDMMLSNLRHLDAMRKLPDYVATKIEPLMLKDLDAAIDLANAFDVDIPATKVVRNFSFDTLDLTEPKAGDDKDALSRGIKMADNVYGTGFGDEIAENSSGNLYAAHTLEHLFANIWTRPQLSIRDRRLLTIGATAAMGNYPDLIKIQVLGALQNNELTVGQLDELVLHLSYYAGWCNSGSVAKGVAEAVNTFRKKNKDTDKSEQ